MVKHPCLLSVIAATCALTCLPWLLLAQGLGELYEDDFVRAAVGGVSEDKDEKIRVEARQLFQVR